MRGTGASIMTRLASSVRFLICDQRAIELGDQQRERDMRQRLKYDRRSGASRARRLWRAACRRLWGRCYRPCSLGNLSAALPAQLSRTGCTMRQPASTMSALWNSVASPIMQS